MKLPFLLLLSCLPVFPQFISVGIKAGVPLTDAYSNVQSGISTQFQDRYTIGPTVEVHLPLHLSFEADALYRHNGFAYASQNTSVNEWQIPLLAKFEVPLGPIRPFVDAGVTYRHLSISSGTLQGLQDPNNAGFSLGGGIGLKLLRIRISPEIRYTHWGQTAIINPAVISQNNQADFLVGLTF